MPRVPFGTERIVASQNALSTTAEKIASVSAGQHRVIVKNTDASITVYLGHSDAVTSANGMPLLAGESIALYTRGEVWAIAASGTPTVAIILED